MTLIADAVLGFFDKLYHYGLPFIVVLSILVFVHEFGHFWVARRCGVKIETFSIGFGGEIFGWTDGLGTRWRVGWLPIGGFVKMFGDADASSRPDATAAAGMSEEEKRVSFVHKALWQKAAIVAAGPGINFLFAILIMAGLFATVGQPFTPPVIGKILPDSAAAAAGLMPGDKIVAADGVTMARFEDLQRTVMLNSGEPMRLSVVREGATIDIAVTPRVIAEKDLLGNVEKVGLLGVQASGELVMRHEDPATALWQGARETWSITANSLETVWQMIVGRRSADGLSGPIGIGQLSGEVWREGFIPVVHFIALLSINLGLINLFPIPVLDGGHLLFYAIEGVRRRPLDERAIAFGFRVGFALIVSFFVFVMWHDLARLMHVAPGT